jgi:hypothetical protein
VTTEPFTLQGARSSTISESTGRASVFLGAVSGGPAERLPTPGLGIRLRQQFVTVAGMVAVITAALAGSAGGLLAAVVSGHSLVAALVAGARPATCRRPTSAVTATPSEAPQRWTARSCQAGPSRSHRLPATSRNTATRP